jgi:hypothetical protein
MEVIHLFSRLNSDGSIFLELPNVAPPGAEMEIVAIWRILSEEKCEDDKSLAPGVRGLTPG